MIITVGSVFLIAGILGFLNRQGELRTLYQRTSEYLNVNSVSFNNGQVLSQRSRNIADKQNLFNVEIPEEWTITQEDPQGIRVTGITAESPDYLAIIDNFIGGAYSSISYENGAQLDITVVAGSIEQPPPTTSVSHQENIVVDGISAVYREFSEPNTTKGLLLDTRLEHNGNSYFIRFGHNPETFPEGKVLFKQILDSISLR